MTRDASGAIATRRHTSRAWWFLGTLAVLRNPDNAPRTPAVIELTVPAGGSPPRHIHDSVDDSFLVLDGELVVCCGDQMLLARPGTYVALPAGIEHTFRVVGAQPAKLLLVHADDSFVRFIEAVGTTAPELRLPPQGEDNVDQERLARVAAEHGIRFVGAPLDDHEARSFIDRGNGCPPPMQQP